MNKNVLKFMVFIMLLNIITPLFNKNDAFAARDISSTNVTDLTVSPSKIEDGGKTTVKMTFDDKNGKIQNGDTIKVAWPTSGTVKIEGYSKTVPLTVKGEQVGQAVITPDGATITFNDKVATITSGNKSTNVTVHKSEAGTSSVFYYKTGDMLPEDTTHVRWFLNINNEKRYVSKDITIKDQIQGGQQLDLSTLNINVTGTHSNYYSGSNAITDFEKAFPGSKITVDNTKNTIDVTIPQGYGSYNSFSINYKTKITNEQQKEFVNNSQAWYQEHGKEEVNGKSFNHTVHNINANAGIEGTVKGELKVLKQDKDTKAPIANVKFKLSKKDGSVVKDNQKEIEIITDANGIANIKALPSGDYILKEIEAPAPYTFDKDKEYPFTMKDTDNQGYFTTIENAKAIEKTKDVSAQKVWEGSQKVKPTIYFKLYKQDDNQNTTPVDKAEIKKLEDGTTKVTWSNLPENDKNGKAIKYLVKEVNAQGEDTTPEGYTKKENGLVVTNTEKPIETTSISGEKVWDDKDNQDGKRPEKVSVNLLANGEKVKTVDVTSETNWKYEFKNLPKYDEGKKIEYTVTEDHVKDYTTDINGTTITNKYTPGETSATVTKNWDDNNNQDGKRPTEIKVELYQDGKATGKTATLNESNNWTHTWAGLDEKAKGQQVKYTVEELTKVKGYTTHVDNNDMGNLIVTNKYTPETTSISGEKVWDDKDNQDGKRPEKVSVNLLANGEKVETVDVTSETNWKYEFKNLPKYDEGKKIEYTVTEDHVKDYTTDINGTTITNKYTPGETSATVTKNWDDNNNQDGKRPTEIKVELYQDGKATGKTATLNESNNWTHTWAGLDEKAKGQQVKYTVEELTKVKGYTTHVDNNDIGNLIVTNKYTPEKPNKPIYPEKPKDKTPPTKPDHSNKVKPTPPDKPSKVDKADQSKDNKTKPENPLKELPKTGMKIITSWITWVFIGILGLYLILRKRFNS
ncbi:TPA: Cna B-type domain-containing protein [Staphylococcus aureus]|nr:Cna B-type domain-containing protein [Staphylococcus aureus]